MASLSPKPTSSAPKARCLPRLSRVLLVAVLAAAWAGGESAPAPSAAGAPAPPTEYELKAAFLHKFSVFTEWPEGTFRRRNSPFVIAVVGEDPFEDILENVLEDEEVGDHPIQLRRWEDVEDIGTCHLLFVPDTERRNLDDILEEVEDEPVLLVGEFDDFAQDGGMINFYVERNKVRFEINPDEAERSDLTIDSKLLRLARIVEDEDDREAQR